MKCCRKFKGITSFWSGVSVKLCNLLKALLVCISDPFWYFRSIVYSLSLSKSVLSLVVGDSVLLLIMYSIALWSTKTLKYLLQNNCIKLWMFTNNPVISNSVTPKFFADFGSLLEWYPITTYSSPCFCNKVPPAPSLDVSLSSWNNPSGVGAFRRGGLLITL